MKEIDVKNMRLVMRIPTDQEYDRLIEATGGNNSLMHGDWMYSWVNDKNDKYKLLASARAARGYGVVHRWAHYYTAAYRSVSVGFRPAFDLTVDALPYDIQDGDKLIIGTLYMNGKPVHVPQELTEDGDIVDYVPGEKLEMRPALEDPAYQVTGIFVGSGVLVADRILLKNISYLDIEKSLVEEAAPRPTVPTENTADYLPAGSVGFKLNRNKLEERGFCFDDTDDAYLYAAGLVDWLASHSENYTPEQYHRIQSLKDIFASIDYGA